MMKIKLVLVVFALSMILSESRAQVSAFVPMDESMQQLINFYQTDTIIVVVPNDYTILNEDKAKIENFAFWAKDIVYIYKEESLLQSIDEQKHQQFFGPINKFVTDILAGTPFMVDKKGFLYAGRKYYRPENSFYYMNNSATRVYTCSNELKQPFVYTEYLAGGVYQLYIFSGSSIILSGFDKGDGSTPCINDLDRLRDEYFCQTINSQFFDLHFACSYSTINNNFFSTMLNYSISGVFVKHIIDRIGLEKFKIAYAQNCINTILNDNELPLEYLIDEFMGLYGSN